MSELSDLVTIFGTIDEAVVADRGLAAKVAPLLPAYGQGAAGWYQGVSRWIPAARRLLERSKDGGDVGSEADVAAVERALSPQSASSDIKAALSRLASVSEDDLLAGDLIARRFLALAVLGRIWPSPGQADSPFAQCLFEADVTEDDLLSALQPLTLGGTAGGLGGPAGFLGGPDGEKKAKRLLRLLTDAQRFPGLPDWDDLLGQAVEEGLIAPALAQLSCAPCSWTVKPTTEAGGVAIAFLTHKRITGMKLDDFDDLFVPARWTNFTPPWCAMTLGTPSDGHDVYLEVLSADCAVASHLSLRTPLKFGVGPLPDATGNVLQYRLAQNWSSEGGDGVVSVDEGSIVAREWKGAIHLITTKRVQFRPLKWMSPLEVAWIAQFVWALGYNALAEYFVNRVALRKHIHVTDADGPHQTRRRRRCPSASEQLGDVVKKELAECVGGIESSLGNMKNGSYDTAAYVNDVGRFVSHVVRYGVSLVNIGSALTTNGGGTDQGTFPMSPASYVSEPMVLPPPSVPVIQSAGPLVLECSALDPGLEQSGPSGEQIPAQAVKLEPATLSRDDEPFRLVIKEGSLQLQPGGTYKGTVTSPNLPNTKADVWIVIP